MNIGVVGAGYVGLSLALLLSQQHNVVLLDVDEHKVDLINNQISPISDNLIEEYLARIPLIATCDWQRAYREADIVILAVPTNYDEVSNQFDMSIVESCIDHILSVNQTCTIVIKSTVPIGYTLHARQQFKTDAIVFSPEFLREGRALYDNLYPARIIVGDKTERGRMVARLLKEAAKNETPEVLLTDSSEAEAIKLFANSYLAMRVSFFNELDSFCMKKGLSTSDIVQGIGLDPRIGLHYNNPSFGYSGYCLPKDTKQLRAEFEGVPESLISAIVTANDVRKAFLAECILAYKPQVVGCYRLTMKSGSDNMRATAVLDVLEALARQGIQCAIYEPLIGDDEFSGFSVMHDLDAFKNSTDVIIANRWSAELEDVKDKVLTRDLFKRD